MYHIDEMKNKKLAFVCSGGVVKAASWHIGVSLALKELGFSFFENKDVLPPLVPPSQLNISTVVGSSAGAFIGCYLSSGLDPIDMINANISNDKRKFPPITYKDIFYLKRPMATSLFSKAPEGPFQYFPYLARSLLNPFLKLSGVFSTQGISNYLKKHILKSNSFEDGPNDLFIVATPLDYSHKVVFGKKILQSSSQNPVIYRTQVPISEAAAASMSVPPFFSPYPILDSDRKVEYFIDGEIRDTLSTHVAIDNGCEYIISSWTHTPYHFNSAIGSLMNYGLPAICVQSIYLMIQSKIISSRKRTHNSRLLVDAVFKYLKNENFPSEKINTVMEMIETQLYFKRNVKLIDIFPKPNNYKMFLSSFFSLNPETNLMAIKMGHRRTLEVFKNREWE